MSLVRDIWGSTLRLPTPVQVWVFVVLMPVNLAALLVVGQPWGGVVAGLAVGALAVNGVVMVRDRGFSLAMALPHVVLWIPLLGVIAYLLLGHDDVGGRVRGVPGRAAGGRRDLAVLRRARQQGLARGGPRDVLISAQPGQLWACDPRHAGLIDPICRPADEKYAQRIAGGWSSRTDPDPPSSSRRQRSRAIQDSSTTPPPTRSAAGGAEPLDPSSGDHRECARGNTTHDRRHAG